MLRPLGADTQAFLETCQPMLIGGDQVRAGHEVASVNPADGKPVGSFYAGGADEAEAAVDAAREAFVRRRWHGLSPAERALVLARVAQLIERDADTLAELEAVDAGKRFVDARNGDVAIAAAAFRYHSGWCTKLEGRVVEVGSAAPGEFHCYLRREPIGVAALIVPWNGPLAMTAWKLAPALAAGCTAIVKPPEQASLSVLRLGALLAEAGLPPGVVNIVTGPGRVVGEALAAHADVDKVSFTGSTETGRRIIRAAAGNFKKLTLELGGKSPAIVFGDADLEAAADGIAEGIFAHAGQVCVASSRLIAHASVAETLVAAIVARARRLRLGPGLDPDTDLGPLISAEHRRGVEALVARSIASGAVAATGGRSCEGAGFFFEPTVLTGVSHDTPAEREEVFGPVLSVRTFIETEEAVALANDTRYGLAGSVWTRDLRTAHQVVAEVRAGLLWINTHGRPDVAVPFGGYRQSGWGREQGRDAVESFTELKSVMAYLGPRGG
jgi:phenylacetaldehyde dehydrogenase